MAQKIKLNVNGEEHNVDAPPDSMLLYALRDNMGLRGPKFGCGLSECGACTIVLDGKAIHSCVTPLKAAEGHKITTLEGLTENGKAGGKPGRLQQAFVDEQALQCGYCINGMIMRSHALLMKNPNPSRDDIKHALNKNLCRCGTHMRIIRAVERAVRGHVETGGTQS